MIIAIEVECDPGDLYEVIGMVEDIENHRIFHYGTPIRVINMSLDNIPGQVLASNEED
jgi:hypothetical protein